MLKIVDYTHFIIKTYFDFHSSKSIYAIDATCGNGFDSLFIAKLLKENDVLHVYDIQDIAIENTKNKTKSYKNVYYHLQSFESIDYTNVNVIIFNLGYLPNGNKSITTKADTTLDVIDKLISTGFNNKLDLIIIAVYPGHEEGSKEAFLLNEYLKKLDSKKYLATVYQNINRPLSPYVITISKNFIHQTII